MPSGRLRQMMSKAVWDFDMKDDGTDEAHAPSKTNPGGARSRPFRPPGLRTRRVPEPSWSTRRFRPHEMRLSGVVALSPDDPRGAITSSRNRGAMQPSTTSNKP